MSTDDLPAVPLRLDATRCDGVGMCAVQAPDIVTLDRWGFPVVADVAELTASGDLTPVQVQRQLRRAIRACPHRVLSR